ncbi:HVA22-like protein a isoform X1 [Chenopodium quinoa]|uniref:HVA22-like protein a isoform X1 n=1 Tax=Chenopodium quinoa TaxID=63459 RepID=UPI000B789561|nr:HVA22-like protein a isoform X1 [Chenopodium quinoa]
MGSSGKNEHSFLYVVASNFDVLAGPLVALVYPLYASIKAIESGSRSDDQQWLTYWVLYSLITIFELSFAKVLEWFPIWSYAKLFFTCWLVLPQFNGATYVYRHFIRPFYMNPQMTTSTMWYIPKKNLFSKQDDILYAAEKYIEQNGTEAFERIIKKADREAKARRKHYMIFEEDHKIHNKYNGYY